MKLEEWMVKGLQSCTRKNGGRYLSQEIAKICHVSHPTMSRWQAGDYSRIDDDAGARLVQFLAAEGIRPPQPKGGGLEDDRDSSVLAALVDRWPELSRSKRHLVAGTIMGLLGAINGQEKHAH
jgi:hypothetical protein